jgi:hypothetical protein
MAIMFISAFCAIMRTCVFLAFEVNFLQLLYFYTLGTLNVAFSNYSSIM